MGRRYKLPKDTLSPRELEMAKLLCDELSVNEAAAKMKTSRSTAETHKSRIYIKLRVSNRIGLYKAMVKCGLL